MLEPVSWAMPPAETVVFSIVPPTWMVVVIPAGGATSTLIFGLLPAPLL